MGPSAYQFPCNRPPALILYFPLPPVLGDYFGFGNFGGCNLESPIIPLENLQINCINLSRFSKLVVSAIFL